jgi:hypothetical protein
MANSSDSQEGSVPKMRRTIVLSSLVASLVTVLVLLLAQRLLVPPQAAAQEDQPQEVRASAFVLVNPSGTVLARLGAGPLGGGNLTMYGADGIRHTVVGGNGDFLAYDTDGTTLRYLAGYRTQGAILVNGVLLGTGGTVDMLPTSP